MAPFIAKHTIPLVLALSLIACTEEAPSSHTDLDTLTETLLNARTTNTPAPLLTENFGLLSLEEAYVIERKLADKLIPMHGEITGYKVAFATADALELYELDAPVTGSLYKSYEIPNGGTVNIDDFFLFHIETEIAFTLKSDIIEPLASVEELKPYVALVHTAFDIADERYDVQPGQTRTIYDFVANGSGATHYVIGQGIPAESVDLDAITLTMYKDDQKIYEGHSTNIMGSPWNVLLSIANAHVRRGNPMKAGDVIVSGKVSPPFVASGENAIGAYVGDCGPLGKIAISVL